MSTANIRAASWLPPVEIEPSRPFESKSEVPRELDDSGAGVTGQAARLATLSIWSQRPWALPAFLGGIVALVVVALAFDAADLMGRSFAVSHALGVLVTVVLSVTVGTALKLAFDEMVAVRRLRQIDGLRVEADQLVAANGHGGGLAFTETMARFYGGRDDLASALQSLNNAVTDAHNDGEVVALIDRQVMAGIDQLAYASVLRASRDTALATALSPSAALDVAIVLWRNLKMVREVSTLYGARPGHFGCWRLMRRMLANLAVAGAAESVGHVAADVLGGSLAAAISSRLGQGMINGLLTARVGLAAMNLCRPISFTAENKPTLRRIRNELMSVPKDVL
ncbi:MAG: TIGR01620 family protein [Rhodospirillaceae bacterium]